MKNSTKRKWKKGFAVRAAALTFFVTLLLVYGTGVFLFSDFVFLTDNRNAATPSAVFLSPEEPDKSSGRNQTHYEAAGEASGTLEPAAKTGLTFLPKAIAGRVVDAVGIFEDYGIPYTLRECWSVQQAGKVIGLEYAGVSDETGYYVNPEVPVVLHISGNKLKQPENTGDNVVYLTFDDGPSPYTEQILDTLGLYGVPAAFFTLGESVEKYPDIARRITADGHILASHGTTHEYDNIYKNADALLNDVAKWQKIVTDTGALTEGAKLYFRFPGGSVSTYFGAAQRKAMIEGLHWMGFSVYDWTVLTNDGVLFLRPAGTDSMDYLKKSFLETWAECPAGAPRILLMHDTVKETADLLPWLIRWIVDEGYTFGTMDMLEEEYFMQ